MEYVNAKDLSSEIERMLDKTPDLFNEDILRYIFKCLFEAVKVHIFI